MTSTRISVEEILRCAKEGRGIPQSKSLIGVVVKVLPDRSQTRLVAYVRDESGTVPVVYEACSGTGGRRNDLARVGQAIKCTELSARERQTRSTLVHTTELVANRVSTFSTATSDKLFQRGLEDATRRTRLFDTLLMKEGEVMFCNLVGVAVKVYTRKEITTKTGRTVQKQSILLSDGEQAILCTFWGNDTQVIDDICEKRTGLLFIPYRSSQSLGVNTS